MGSIRNSLVSLVLVAILPAGAVLLYTSVEQRQIAIKDARTTAAVMAHVLAESQRDMTGDTQQMLSTLALLPQVKALDVEAVSRLFRYLVEQNPRYFNITLVGLDGYLLASNRPFEKIYLGDRKHFREALERKGFAAGEYIVTRVGNPVPAFPFAYPVLDDEGHPRAILTTVINLSVIDDYYLYQADAGDRMFIAATDHLGVRLFYYPPQDSTNPIGSRIREESWAAAKGAEREGFHLGHGSDGQRRIFAYEPLRLKPGDPPYMYIWAGILESDVLQAANTLLVRNLLLLLAILGGSLLVAWRVGESFFVAPIRRLIDTTLEFAAGRLDYRDVKAAGPRELKALRTAFYDMAEQLQFSKSALAESEARLRLILDSAAEAIYGLDGEVRCTFINRSALDILGYESEQDLLGRNMHDILHHTDHEHRPYPQEQCHIIDAIRLGRKVHVEGELFWRADGTSFPVEFWSYPAVKDGEVIGAVVTFLDITERIRARQEREALVARLQDKTEEQERFIYTVSHDLKSPLVTIGGFLGLLEQDFATRDEAGFRENLQTIAGAVHRMRDLLSDLLDISRVGVRPPDPEVVSLGELAEEAIRNVSGQVVADKADIQVEPDLPQVAVDRKYYLQVLENLIVNAVKFSRNAENGPRVRIGVRRHDGRLVCCVTDNGVGIAAPYANKVFGLFEKLDTQSDGTGVGLAIVRRIVEAHGGEVWVESAGEGQGATFCFTVPEPPLVTS